MCGTNFKSFDHMDCKRAAFKVKKTSAFASCGTRLFDFEPS